MRKKGNAIPVNHFGDETANGISIERIAFESLPDIGEWEQPERHDRHSFFLLETGKVTMEIDFEHYEIIAPSIIYMHPDQVHRILGFENVTVCAWAVTDENLNAGYLQTLEEISPAAPLHLNQEMFALLAETASLCLKFLSYPALLKDSANALTGLVITYLQSSAPAGKTRVEVITKTFRQNLERHFTSLKRPADYAEKLNITTAYLNECVKNATGQPVSHHIQQRNILEAKRLVYHSSQSLKEIAASLGYEDYAYFSRLFTKTAGVSPKDFRSKNRD